MGRSRRQRRIVIIDDHPVVRFGARQLIEMNEDYEVVGEAPSVSEGLELIDRVVPDLALVDLTLADGSGLELIKRIKARGEGPAILVWSIHDDALFAERALSAGARGYVNKTQATEALLSAIDRVLAGRIYLSAGMTERLLQQFVGRGVSEGSLPEEVLSDRELEVFERLGRGRTTREVAADLGLSIKTIETHRENIKAKLQIRTGNELIRRAAVWVARGA